MSGPGGPPLPRYGERSLVEVVPSVLAAAGVDGFANALGLERADRACVLVVDGLGWELAAAHRHETPTLAVGQGIEAPISAGFPATTATSLASIGTGLAPGEHGMVGYCFAVPGYDRPMNALLWQLYGIGPRVDLTEEVPPETVQANATVFQRAADAGLTATVVGPTGHARSSLTRAVLRGGRYRGADTVEALVDEVTDAMASGERAAVYAYYPWLDTAGHVSGVGSVEWRRQLALVDGLVDAVARHLPPGGALYVTADHGMVNLGPSELLDVADRPELLRGVRFLGGEARARHVYAEPGAGDEVLRTWRDALGDGMWVRRRDEAIEEGWFGAVADPAIRARIGDVVAAARAPLGIVQRDVDPMQASFAGHHGSMTGEEQLVPLFEYRP